MHDIQKWLDDFRKEEEARNRRYGKVKPIISANAIGQRVVAVGGRLYAGTWRTFPDFLRDHIWYVIGREWFKEELRKPEVEQHPIMRWWMLYHEFAKKQTPNEDGLIDSIPNGITKALYQLAYDLYILSHHQVLHKNILQRLLIPEGFQGARYELFVTSTMIRAGFRINHEDESDRSKKHVEFIAKHKDLGEEIAVEAKSRHRAGVLGAPGKQDNPDSIKLRLGRLINSAIGKGHSHPLVIFVDMNLPAETAERTFEGKNIRALVKILDQVGKEGEEDSFNLILYTNHPYHYGEGDEPYDPDHLSLAIANSPRYEIQNPLLIEEIIRATKQYGNIPNGFPDD